MEIVEFATEVIIIRKEDGKKYTRDMDVHLPQDDGVHIRDDNRSIVMTKIQYRVSRGIHPHALMHTLPSNKLTRAPYRLLLKTID